MTIVKHPRIPGVQRSVSEPEKWVAAGWIVDPPAEAPKPRPRRRVEPDVSASE